MQVTMNNIEYTTSVSNGEVTITHNAGSFRTSGMTEEEALKEMILKPLREKRDKLLSESDYRDLPSYPGNDQEAWRTYRTKLRDLPSTYNQGSDIVLPNKPIGGQ